MHEDCPSVFISYCWENSEQRDWVVKLANLLRKNGVDATCDFFEIQKGTINLFNMMIEKIRCSDFTIVILSYNYALKADAMQGGVGFETNMLLPYLQNNLHKIIPVMPKWNKTKAMPFYLNGVHYIDFSNEIVFKEKFNELLHRIFRVDLIELDPVGEKPKLEPRRVGGMFPDNMLSTNTRSQPQSTNYQPYFCECCGHIIPEGQRFCFNCGNPSKGYSGTANLTNSQSQSTKYDIQSGFCEYCGNVIAGKHRFCPICGTPLKKL